MEENNKNNIILYSDYTKIQEEFFKNEPIEIPEIKSIIIANKKIEVLLLENLPQKQQETILKIQEAQINIKNEFFENKKIEIKNIIEENYAQQFNRLNNINKKIFLNKILDSKLKHNNDIENELNYFNILFSDIDKAKEKSETKEKKLSQNIKEYYEWTKTTSFNKIIDRFKSLFSNPKNKPISFSEYRIKVESNEEYNSSSFSSYETDMKIKVFKDLFLISNNNNINSFKERKKQKKEQYKNNINQQLV